MAALCAETGCTPASQPEDGSRKTRRMRKKRISFRSFAFFRALCGPKCLRLPSTNAAPALQLKRQSGRSQERRVGGRRVHRSACAADLPACAQQPQQPAQDAAGLPAARRRRVDESEMAVHQVSLAQAVGRIADPPYSFRSGGVGCVTSRWLIEVNGVFFRWKDASLGV